MEGAGVSQGRAPITAIVFDLDGTLVDSVPDLHAAANRLMSEMQLAPLEIATVTSFVGNGIPTLVERCLAAAGSKASEAETRVAVARFKSLYAEEPAIRTVIYPGVVEALDAFQAAGYGLGVCTNKSEALARAVLRDVGLGDKFSVVIGGDTLATHKPDPEGLLSAIDALASTPDTALYVGDSEVDAETAARGRVAFALFANGYRKAPLAELPHWHAFDNLHQLALDIGLVPAAGE
ncbi:MAG: phosphoglycolate phosphatase [Hyphomicrobiaceae bacterium]|nr:phosphoglycolate phosphatase [Hyphomicrobiaceae bacterium]